MSPNGLSKQSNISPCVAHPRKLRPVLAAGLVVFLTTMMTIHQESIATLTTSTGIDIYLPYNASTLLLRGADKTSVRNDDSEDYDNALFHANKRKDKDATNQKHAPTTNSHVTFREKLVHKLEQHYAAAVNNKTTTTQSSSYLSRHKNAPIVPFVYLVHSRVDFLKIAIESLRASDFDKERVPLIISHDGHVPDVVDYVEQLKSEFHVIQIFHPHSCYDHPNTFPGNDEKLNKNYKGDSFGNNRTGDVTCAKHHFTWMLKTVFEMNFSQHQVEWIAFFEEDYVVAPTIYETIVSGVSLYHKLSQQKDDQNGYFGLVFEGSTFDYYNVREGWKLKNFVSGPMALTRDMYQSLLQQAKEYCTYDEYNWDWSIVHLMDEGHLPFRVLYPTKPQVMHIGLVGGMHKQDLSAIHNLEFPPAFHGTDFVGTTKDVYQPAPAGPFGGWGHAADHKHCLEVLTGGRQH